MYAPFPAEDPTSTPSRDDLVARMQDNDRETLLEAIDSLVRHGILVETVRHEADGSAKIAWSVTAAGLELSASAPRRPLWSALWSAL